MRWTNWSRVVAATPTRLERPRTLEALRAALARGGPVRFVGHGCSASAVAASQETMISTADLPRAVRIVGDRAVVASGVPMGTVAATLAHAGWRLGVAGTSVYPTMGGALATGLHGSGLGVPTFADASTVRGARLWTVAGACVDLDEDRPADRPLLAALRVNLGALGFVEQLTLQLTPGATLQRRTDPIDEADLLDAAVHIGWEQAEAWWVPGTGRALLVRRRPATGRTSWFDRPISVAAARWFGEDLPLRAMVEIVGRAPSLAPRLRQGLVDVGMGTSDRIRRWDLATMGPRHLRAPDLELAVPRDGLAAAMDVVRGWVAGAGHAYLLPVNVRWNAADHGTLLSPCAGRDTAWLDFAWHAAVPGGLSALAELEALLFPLGARPHWGKLGFANPKAQFPNFDDWERVRATLDPDGRLVNPHVDRLRSGAPLRDI